VAVRSALAGRTSSVLVGAHALRSRAMDRLLLTGAAGRIGSVLRRGLRDDVGEIRLVDREALTKETANEVCEQVDLRDFPTVARLVDGVDAVVHMAAISGEAPFPDILDTNIRMTFHVLEAARRHGVARVVLASSNHVTGLYPPDVRVGPASPTRPDSFYGVGKVCDEALGRLYAEKFGLEVACLRIGTFAQRPTSERALATWLSPDDCVELVRRSLSSPSVTFTVLYGVSDNARAWWDNPAADAVGYRPADDADRFADEIGADADRRANAWQGGPFAVPEASMFDDVP
jgi:uronate dehydrogenase